MKKNMSRTNRLRNMLLLIILLAIIMAVAIIITGIRLFSTYLHENREQVVSGAAKLASELIDGDRIDDWLENGPDEEYLLTQGVLSTIRENTPDLKYLYIYKILPDGCHVVFDCETEDTEPSVLGEVLPFDASFQPHLETLLAGGDIDLIESNDSFGWLLTDYEPIYDSEGKCVAYAGADISMDEIQQYRHSFILHIILISAIFILLCIILEITVSIRAHKANEMDNLLKQQERDQKLLREIIESFAKVIDLKDPYTQGHSTRVAEYTALLTRELGYDEDIVERNYNIALMHDIGKIGIPDKVLNKPERLTDEEYEIMKSHTTRGGEALKNISLMPEIAIGAEYHHERPDGKGYPKGLKGDQIPRVAQIIAVADTFDAMYSTRPYRKRMDFDKVVDIIKKASGTQLDRDVVDAFLRLAEKGEFRVEEED